MSEFDDERLSPEAERAREAVVAAAREANPARADATLRARLREAFTSGRIDERERAAAESGVGTRPRVVPAQLPRFAPTAMRVAFAAAALILVAGLLNQGPRWSVLAGSGGDGAAAEPGVVEIDGVPTLTTDITALASRIKPGAEIRIAAGAPLRLVSGNALALELPPGAEMTLPPPPARWVGRQSEIYSRAGEIRITTGPQFRGARLAIHTEEAIVELIGTTVAVIRDEHGTCVCVLEGAVRMGAAPGPKGVPDATAAKAPMATIPAGTRCLIYKDSRSPLVEPISDMERAKLSSFRDALTSPWKSETITR